MKSNLALFFQVLIVFIGIGTLAVMLWEPHLEGRNTHATTFEIYFKDPFLAYAYVGSSPFFVALHRAFGLFRHVRQNGAFSQVSVDALRAIKYSAMAMIVFVPGALIFIIMFGDEDRPAGVFMCLLVTLASSIIAAAAAIFARRLQNVLRVSEGSRAPS